MLLNSWLLVKSKNEMKAQQYMTVQAGQNLPKKNVPKQKF
jgi:hypothetical protein